MSKLEAIQLLVYDRMRIFAVIEHSGQRYIVLTWLANKAAKVRKPEYVLPLESVDWVDLSSDLHARCRYGASGVFPASLLDRDQLRNGIPGFQIEEGPPVGFPMETIQ